MVRVDDFKPLLPLLRFIAAWTYIVTFPLSFFGAGSFIPRLIEIIVTGIGFILSLTVGILDHKDRKRVRNLGTSPRPPSMVVICLDFFLALCFLAVWIMYLLSFGLYYGSGSASRGNYYYYNGGVFSAHAYAGALVGLHLEIFFGAIYLHMWRQHRNGRTAAASFEQRERAKGNTTITATSPVSPADNTGARLPAYPLEERIAQLPA